MSDMGQVTGKRVEPPSEDEMARRRTSREAALHQAVWECSQHMSTDAIRAFVDQVCFDIESDAE